MDASTPPFGNVPPGPLVQIRSYARPSATQDHTTTRVALRPIAGWRMDYGRFEFDSSFVEPEAALEIPHLARLVGEHPGSPVSIFGHTDPTGDDDYNKQLSGRRALAVYGLFVRDVDLWDSLYQQPMAGDRWGERAVQRMLTVLTDGEGKPYYQGTVDDFWGPGSAESLRRFQGDNGLDVDGIPGPNSRKALYRLYMDALCAQPDGSVFLLTDEGFLARGADPEHRGDVQGCSEFNPSMVFSAAEHQKFQAFQHREERNVENSVNRRVVVFLYPAGVEIDVSKWPCPAARTGSGECRKRFWSDAATRRNPQEERRHFDGDFDTFACRFYHYIGFNTPAETPEFIGQTFDVYLHRGAGDPHDPGTFRVISDDGEVDDALRTQDAVLLESAPGQEVRCLAFPGLQRGRAYTLLFKPDADEEPEPVVLLSGFRVEDFAARAGSEPEPTAVPYAANKDDAYLEHVPEEEAFLDWDEGDADPEHWQVEQESVDWEGMQVVLTTITEGDDG
jgi:hypothetical protein